MNNRGFIQLPILAIAVVLLVVLLAGGTFYVAHNSVSYKQEPQLAAVGETQLQGESKMQTLGEQTAQQEPRVAPAQTPEKTSASIKPAVHKVVSINSPQEPKTQSALPKTTPVINPPSQPETQKQPTQTQPSPNQQAQNQPIVSPQPTTPTTPAQTPTPQPAPSSQSEARPATKVSVFIILKDIGETTAQIEWTTSESTESRLYLSGGGVSSEQHASQNGYSTKHSVTLGNLKPATDYSFQITATGNSGFADYTDGFKTKTPSPTLQITPTGGTSIPLESSGNKITWASTYATKCTASGDWSGDKNTSGEYALSFSQAGTYTYTLTCNGNNGENVTKNIALKVFETTPKVAISVPLDTPSGGTVAKGAVDVSVFKLNVKRVSGSSLMLDRMKVRLIGGSSLAKDKIKVSRQDTTYSNPSVNGDTLTYYFGNLQIGGDGTFQFVFKVDVPETAIEGETFHLEFVSIEGMNTYSGDSVQASGTAISNEFTVVQPI